MGFFDMIGNAVNNRVESKMGDFESIPDLMGSVPEAIGNKFSSTRDYYKALTQDPESFEKFLMENPEFLKKGSGGGIRDFPPLPQPTFGQIPNYLNSAQQVLRGGY